MNLSPRTGKSRVLELDVLRGIAALAVVLFHYTVRFSEIYGYPHPPIMRFPVGFYGVEVFFCISGFVIFMTLDRTRQPLDFVVSRVSRLWPAFIVSIIITFTFVHLFGLPGRETSVYTALINFTMIPGLLHVHRVDGVYWSLQVELIFYVWMFLAYQTGLLKHIRVLLFLDLLTPIIYTISLHYFGRTPSYLAGELLLVNYIPYFTIGIAAYNIWAKKGPISKDVLLMLAAICVIATSRSVQAGFLALIAAVIFCLIAGGYLKGIARGPLIFLGTISYPLYLLHQNIGYIVIRDLVRLDINTNVAILCAVTISISLASIVTWGVERPARSLLRKRYAQHLKQKAEALVASESVTHPQPESTTD